MIEDFPYKKIERLETHDRYLQFKSQDNNIGETVQKIINERPFGKHAFYLFVHSRTIDPDEKAAILMDSLRSGDTSYKTMDEVPSLRVIWQPRLTKPRAQTNSMLFRCTPGSEEVETIWLLPVREMWDAYKQGKMTECESVCNSIYNFENHRAELEAPHPDDLPDSVIQKVYQDIAKQVKIKQFEFKPILNHPNNPQLFKG